MRSLKGLSGAIPWLFRILISYRVYSRFGFALLGGDFVNLDFYRSLSLFVLTVLLWIGGLAKKESLTVVSSWMLLGFWLWMIIGGASFLLGQVSNMELAVYSLYFITKGNKS